MNYDQDLNCAKYAAEIHGELTFREIGERLGISAPRAKQNEGTALAKLVRRRRVLFDE
jgi:DNA-directed RNA polymerase sigma subunit (sigma70/sigma32)